MERRAISRIKSPIYFRIRYVIIGLVWMKHYYLFYGLDNLDYDLDCCIRLEHWANEPIIEEDFKKQNYIVWMHDTLL